MKRSTLTDSASFSRQINYRYDPTEFHGPTLNYFTLISALLSGRHTYASLTEITLRIVPVFFGLVLVLMPLLLLDGLGRPVAVVACCAYRHFARVCFLQPILYPGNAACVFYFRDDCLVGTDTFAAKSGYGRCGRVYLPRCALPQKKQSVIAFGAVIVALAIVLLTRKDGRPALNLVRPGHLVLAIVGAVVVWGLFFSSFFKNPAGLIDSFRTYAIYFERAGHNQFHIHPWYYYLQLLLYNKADGGPPWTEGFIVVMALVGLLVIISRRGVSGLDSNLLKFIAFYTVIMTVVYSAIPYKTPWCLLSFYHGYDSAGGGCRRRDIKFAWSAVVSRNNGRVFCDVRNGPCFAGVRGEFHFFCRRRAILMCMLTRQKTC